MPRASSQPFMLHTISKKGTCHSLLGQLHQESPRPPSFLLKNEYALFILLCNIPLLHLLENNRLNTVVLQYPRGYVSRPPVDA